MGRRPGIPKVRGSGRKKGSVNKNHRPAQIRKALEGEGITPLQFMLGIMRDPTQPPSIRMDMAKAAAPFCHARRVPEVAEGKPGGTIVLSVNVNPLSRPDE